MQNNNTFKFLLFLILPLVSLSACGTKKNLQQDTLQSNHINAFDPTRSGTIDGPRRDALEAILPNYTNWETAELSGKLRMKKLPISPTIKIFMKKDEEISISVRASLLGEVGRIEVIGDSVTAVNKMKRAYCSESISGIRYDYPDIIGDVQSLLLARIVALKAGELNPGNSDFFDFEEIVDENSNSKWSLTFPRGHSEEDEFFYSYKVNSLGLIDQLLLAASTSDHELSLSLDYSYPGRGFDLNIVFNQDLKQKFDASVEFGDTQWGVKSPAPLNLNSRYTRVGIKQFLKSF